MDNKPGLIANFTAATTIEPRRFVKFSATANEVTTAGSGDVALGVTPDVGANAGQRCDVILTDIAPVVYGDAVTQGQLLKSDDNGAAIPITEGDTPAGLAMVSAASGEIGAVLLR